MIEAYSVGASFALDVRQPITGLAQLSQGLLQASDSIAQIQARLSSLKIRDMSRMIAGMDKLAPGMENLGRQAGDVWGRAFRAAAESHIRQMRIPVPSAARMARGAALPENDAALPANDSADWGAIRSGTALSARITGVQKAADRATQHAQRNVLSAPDNDNTPRSIHKYDESFGPMPEGDNARAMRRARDAWDAQDYVRQTSAQARREAVQQRHTPTVPSVPPPVPPSHRSSDSGGMMQMFGGMEALRLGHAGLDMFNKQLHLVSDYERQAAILRQQGLGDAQISDAKKFVESTKIIGTSISDRMRIFTEAQGAFRESGKSGEEATKAAKAMTPVLATYETALEGLSGEKRAAAESSLRNLSKTVEMMGGLGDPKRAAEIADAVFKASVSSGKMVDERHIKQFFSYGSSATNQQSLRTVLGGLEPIIGELGGSTVGTGLRTAYNRVNGMNALTPKRTYEEMNRLNMADASGKRQTDELAHLQATDIVAYAKKIMEKYTVAGITSQEGRERENAILFGTNGAKVLNKVMSQMDVLEHSQQAFDQAKGAGETVADLNKTGLLGHKKFEAAWADFNLKMGQSSGLLELSATLLGKMSAALDYLTEAMKSHPVRTKWIATALLGFAALMVAGGGLAMMAMPLQALSGTIMGVIRVMRFLPSIPGALIRAIMMVSRVIATAALAGGRMLMGAMISMGPIGWAIAAVAIVLAAGAYLVWKHWDTVKPKLMAMWNWLIGVWNKFGLAISAAMVVLMPPIGIAMLVFKLWQSHGAKLSGVWAEMKTAFSDIFDGAISLIQGLIDKARALLASLPSFSGMKDAASGAAASAGDWIDQKYKSASAAMGIGSPPDKKFSPPPSPSQTVQVSSTVHLDGKVVGTAITDHIVSGANRPATSGTAHDARLSFVQA